LSLLRETPGLAYSCLPLFKLDRSDISNVPPLLSSVFGDFYAPFLSCDRPGVEVVPVTLAEDMHATGVVPLSLPNVFIKTFSDDLLTACPRPRPLRTMKTVPVWAPVAGVFELLILPRSKHKERLHGLISRPFDLSVSPQNPLGARYFWTTKPPARQSSPDVNTFSIENDCVVFFQMN